MPINSNTIKSLAEEDAFQGEKRSQVNLTCHHDPLATLSLHHKELTNAIQVLLDII